MARRDLLLKQKLLSLFRKIEKSKCIGNSRTTLGNCLRHFRLSHRAPLHQPTVSVRLFYRVQIRALNIFNQRKLKSLVVINLFYTNGNLLKTSNLRGLPTALTGNDLIRTIDYLPYKNRLKQTIFFNRSSKFFYFLFFKLGSRLIRIRGDSINLYLISFPSRNLLNPRFLNDGFSHNRFRDLYWFLLYLNHRPYRPCRNRGLSRRLFIYFNCHSLALGRRGNRGR